MQLKPNDRVYMPFRVLAVHDNGTVSIGHDNGTSVTYDTVPEEQLTLLEREGETVAVEVFGFVNASGSYLVDLRQNAINFFGDESTTEFRAVINVPKPKIHDCGEVAAQ